MKRFSLRLWSFLLAMLMVLSLVPMAVMASEEQNDDVIVLTTEGGGTITIIRSNTQTEEKEDVLTVAEPKEYQAGEATVYNATPIPPIEVVYGDGYTKGFDSLMSAMNFGYSASTEKTIIVHKDITEAMGSLEGNITTDNPNGVIIKNTVVDEWIYCSENFTIGEGVTYDATGYASGLFVYAEDAVINGTVLTDCYYQRYADTKLTINEPGSMTVKTESFHLRYTDGDAEAGIYVVGDNDDSTVGLNASVIYFYQGIISAKDADIKVGTYWQTNETDSEGSANLVLDNSNMTVTVNEHNMKATGNSTVTLKNGSSVSVAGGYQGAAVEMDETSSMTKNGASVLVAKVGNVSYASLQAALNAAVVAGDTVEVVLLENIDLTGTTWTPVYFNSYIATGANTLIINGNHKTITGLSDMLFSGIWTGTKFEVKDLTIDKANIKHDVNDTENIGVGAIVGNVSAIETVVLSNVKLTNSYVEGGHWTGGFFGYIAGYSGNDGPVFTTVEITSCAVIESVIVGNGSVGGVVGHATGDAWTSFGIAESTVTGNTITSTGSSNNKAGIVAGTIGAAGTESNGKIGGVSVSVTESGNTAKSSDTVITTVYGRQGSADGKLTVTGGNYENKPVEDNVSYAAPAEGFEIVENADGSYGVVKYVASITDAEGNVKNYASLAAAIEAAKKQGLTEVEIVLYESIDGFKFADLSSFTKATLVGKTKDVRVTVASETSDIATEVIFKRLTVKNTNDWLYSYQYTAKTTYDDCTLIGNFRVTTPAVFTNSTFTYEDDCKTLYNIFIYGGQDITVENCTFNSYERAIKIYNQVAVTTNLTITNTAFTSATVKKSVIEIDEDASTGINIVIDDQTTASGFRAGYISADDGNTFIEAELEHAWFAIENHDLSACKYNVYVADERIYSYVAELNGVKYASLQKAIDAAGDGDTITLIEDFDLYKSVTVAKGQTITLDLNGKTITGEPTVAAGYAVITNKGNLTITGNGTILCDHQLAGSTGYAVNTITNGGTLVIDGATIENKTTASNQIGYAIDNNSGSADAIVTVKGGKVVASGSNYYDGIRLFCNSMTNENSVTVEGGEVSSIWLQNPSDGADAKDTKDVKGSVSITGGTVDALYLEPSTSFAASISGGYIGKVSYFATSAGRDLTGFVTGGTFGSPVEVAFCAAGYQPVDNGDGTYGVKVGASVYGSTVNLGSALGMKFFVEKNVLLAVMAANGDETLEGYYAVITRTYANGKTDTQTVTNWIEYDYPGKETMPLYVFGYGNINAKEMIDMMSFQVFDAEDNAITEVYTDSIQAFTMRSVAHEEAKASPSASLLKLLVDMLNYGAAAQTYETYAVDNLANSKLTEAQKAYGTASETAVPDDNDQILSVTGATEYYYGDTLNLGTDIRMKIFFQDLTPEQLASISAKVTFTNHEGEAYELTYDASDFAKYGDKDYYVIGIDKLVAADANTVVTCVVMIDGETTLTIENSINDYLYRAYSYDTKNQSIYHAVYYYCDSANAYFHPTTTAAE